MANPRATYLDPDRENFSDRQIPGDTPQRLFHKALAGDYSNAGWRLARAILPICGGYSGVARWQQAREMRAVVKRAGVHVIADMSASSGQGIDGFQDSIVHNII